MRSAWVGAVAAAAVLALVLPTHAGPVMYNDPVGDTFGTGPVQQDITTYGASVNLAQGTTTFMVNFAGSIAPASAFQPNSLYGYIDIDVDKNPATGGNAPWGINVVGGNDWINFFVPPNLGLQKIPGPLIQMGDEYYVDLSTDATSPGHVEVLRTSDNGVFATVPIDFSAMGFTVTVPLVGTASDGSMNFDLLMGTFAEFTDRAPNGSAPVSTVVPEPTALVLFGVGLAAVGLVARWSGHAGATRHG